MCLIVEAPCIRFFQCDDDDDVQYSCVSFQIVFCDRFVLPQAYVYEPIYINVNDVFVLKGPTHLYDDDCGWGATPSCRRAARLCAHTRPAEEQTPKPQRKNNKRVTVNVNNAV
jgi:hypothetical protein